MTEPHHDHLTILWAAEVRRRRQALREQMERHRAALRAQGRNARWQEGRLLDEAAASRAAARRASWLGAAVLLVILMLVFAII
jgi:hypothetical protein